MQNKNKDLQDLFKLVRLSAQKTPTEENGQALLTVLEKCIENIQDPVLASNFQTYWLETKHEIKKISEESAFLVSERIIKLSIAQIMFPETVSV